MENFQYILLIIQQQWGSVMYVILRYKQTEGYWRVCPSGDWALSKEDARSLYMELVRTFPKEKYKLLKVTEVV